MGAIGAGAETGVPDAEAGVPSAPRLLVAFDAWTSWMPWAGRIGGCLRVLRFAAVLSAVV